MDFDTVRQNQARKTVETQEATSGARSSQTVFDPSVKAGVDRLVGNIKSVIYIDTRKLEYIIAAKIAGGHVMLADAHGVGKTSLARALAGSIEWDSHEISKDGVTIESFNRIQCTVDLLPQDILGFTRLDGSGNNFIFNKGPIFAHFVLCDEINLLTPKTQGSFFQAMEEQTVTIEGKTYHLSDPFFIIATMNLKGAHLFPLPAPQLDRFMIQLSIGYPDPHDEAEIIKKHGRDDAWDDFKPVISSQELLRWQRMVDKVSIHPDIIDYIVECVRQTRYHPDVLMGASPRTGVKLSRLSRALSLIRGLDYVPIDQVKEVFFTAVSHRLIMQDPDQSPRTVLESILGVVPVDPSRRKIFQRRSPFRPIRQEGSTENGSSSSKQQESQGPESKGPESQGPESQGPESQGPESQVSESSVSDV